MTTISQDSNVCTAIVIYADLLEEQQRLLDTTVAVSTQVLTELPGFLSANIHRSIDGTRIANYMQWESQKAANDMWRQQEVCLYREACEKIAKVELHLYSVDEIVGVPTISLDNTMVVAIIPLWFAPGKQQQVLHECVVGTKGVIAKLPGFVSASFHKGLDGTNIVEYVQWKSLKALDAAFKTPEFITHITRVESLAQADFHLYEVYCIVSIAA